MEKMNIETINSKRRSAGVTGFGQIKSLTASVLALGFCALIITGCGKTSAPKTGAEVTVAEMNQAIQMMSTSPSGGPKKIDDLTNFPTFKGRPFSAPPVGKKLIIDPATHQVVIINQ